MQIIGAYLFEANILDAEALTVGAGSIRSALGEWLTEKGAGSPFEKTGEFISKTRGSPKGSFQWKDAKSTTGEYYELSLEEQVISGQRFITSVSTIISTRKIIVHVTLSVKNADSYVMPVFTDPRCPAVVKKLIILRSDWKFGGQPLPIASPAYFIGSDSGKLLAQKILDTSRRLPIVVISEIDGELIWGHVDEKISSDLAALAHVIRIDEDASWALTDEVGKANSCYLGAIRLYWPVQDNSEGESPRSTVWTASKMLSSDEDGRGSQRLAALVRRAIMNVASLTIEPPQVIREIQNQSARAKLKELEDRANANTEELEFARLCIEENETLKAQLDEAMLEVARQAGKAQAAEYNLSQIISAHSDYPQEPVFPVEAKNPLPGEIRYYKKTHSKPSHDVFASIIDCGHDAWQGANKGDKAKKGLIKLEGVDNWKSIYHCSKCTGGGVWKVIW